METQIIPTLSKERVLIIAKQVLRQNEWAYDELAGLRPIWRGPDTSVPGHEGEMIHLWSVGFTTPPSPFDQVDRFLGIDDQTGKPIYILLGPGRYDF